MGEENKQIHSEKEKEKKSSWNVEFALIAGTENYTSCRSTQITADAGFF